MKITRSPERATQVEFLKSDKSIEQSKRSAFRFRCSKEPVTYLTAYDEGEALLKNISTEGCALEWATNPPELDEKILLSIDLQEEDSVIQIQARVVRVEHKDFAVKFLLIDVNMHETLLCQKITCIGHVE